MNIKLILLAMAGMAIGMIITGIIGIIIGKKVAASQRAAGVNDGRIEERRELFKLVSEKLGDDYQKSDGYETLFTVKTDAVVIVERNGVKTLRPYRGR